MARIKKDNEMEVEYATPLMYAVALSARKMAKTLLLEGADATVVNSGGATALMIAAALDDRVLVNLLLAFDASADDQLESAAFLIPPGCESVGRAASVGKWLPTDAAGATALWLAACAGNETAVVRLLGAGADAGLEATCVSLPGAGDDDGECDPRRAAELRGENAVMALIEEAERAGPASAAARKIPGKGLLK